MKHLNLRNAFFFLALFMSVATFTSCTEDEPTVSEQLNGEWDAKSFTADGVEVMGTLVTSFELEFDDEGDDQGEAKWTIIFSTGQTQVIEGDYEVRDGGDELRISDATGRIDFDMDLSGDELELTGIVSGERWEIEADK